MNYCIKLNNPPKKLIKMLKKLYQRKYKNYSFDIVMSKYHYSVDLTSDEIDQIANRIPATCNNISWNCITDAGPPKPTHIDRGRKAALQIPIIADPSIHKVFVLKEESMLDQLTPQEVGTGFIQKLDTVWKNQRYKDMPMFHKYEDQYFDVMTVEPLIPYITATDIPHGGIHNKGMKTSNSPRYFFSCSLPDRIDFSENVERFKSWH